MSARCLALALAVCLWPWAAGAADLSREMDQLAIGRERELGVAVDGVNSRYQGALQNLFARAVREDDVDTAARVRQALEKMAAKPATLAALGPRASFVGSWVYVFHVDGRGYVMDLNADGSCSESGQRFGSWEVVPGFLVIHYDGHPDWRDRYELPIRDGALTAANDDGFTMTITRRGAPLSAAQQKDLLGGWNFRNQTDGKTGAATLAADGGYLVEGGQRGGTWLVSGDLLVVIHGSLRDGGRDLYELPARNGAMHGKNMAGHSLWLTRAGAAIPPVAAAPAGTERTTWTPAGRWQWHTGPDNTFTADGRVLQRTKEAGRWEWIDQTKGQLRVRWAGGKYTDEMALQPDGVHMTGRSSNGDSFSEERLP